MPVHPHARSIVTFLPFLVSRSWTHELWFISLLLVSAFAVAGAVWLTRHLIKAEFFTLLMALRYGKARSIGPEPAPHTPEPDSAAMRASV